MNLPVKEYIIWFLIITMVSLIMVGSIIKKNHRIENFTPRLGRIYRPFARRVRIFGEGFYNRTKQNMSNLFRIHL